MAQRESITVGHYTYSGTDTARTIANLNSLWEHHTYDSHIPDGWLAGARGFVAEMCSLAAVPLPSLDNVDSAISALTASLVTKYDHLVSEQHEAILAAMWRFFPTMRLLTVEHTGVVQHMHASRGLPKQPITHAEVTWKGIAGDVQSERKHHGRPWQALCIWSTDAIERLRSEGHPISPGYAGENITVTDIPSEAFRPGAHFRVGSVRGFMTAYAIPCKKNSAWFTNGDFMRMSHDRGQESRVYAMVTTPGDITVGDAFELFTDR